MIHRCQDPATCDGDSTEFAGHVWHSCPYLALDDPYLAIGQHLADAQEWQPLAGWPTDYSIGMQAMVQHVRHARAVKARKEAEH